MKNNRYYENANSWKFYVNMESFACEYNNKYINERIEVLGCKNELIINGRLKRFFNDREVLEWMAKTEIHSDLKELLNYVQEGVLIDWSWY